MAELEHLRASSENQSTKAVNTSTARSKIPISLVTNNTSLPPPCTRLFFARHDARLGPIDATVGAIPTHLSGLSRMTTSSQLFNDVSYYINDSIQPQLRLKVSCASATHPIELIM